MKKHITRTLTWTAALGIIITLILNFFVQLFQESKNFYEYAAENFQQIERMIETNDKNLKQVKADFADECIVHARSAAYIVEHDSEIIDNLEECKKLADLLEVDEIHFFNTDGVIYAGTHPEYYGYSFSSGEQMAFFAPMLENHSLELCQDVTPNTAEHKLMQYAAVWRQDGKGIVQIGVRPERVLAEIEGNDISNIFALISTDAFSEFYAVDAESQKVIASTNESSYLESVPEFHSDWKRTKGDCRYGQITIDGDVRYYIVKTTGKIWLIKTYPRNVLIKEILRGDMLLAVYYIILFLLLILTSYQFLERQIVRSMVRINEKLEKISQGNWDTVLEENSTPEFEKLSRHINRMVRNLVDFFGKMSKALELSKVPIGICEYVPETGIFTVTSRVKDILLLTDEEFEAFQKHAAFFEEKMAELLRVDIGLGDNIYLLEDSREHYVRAETLFYKNSQLIILTDVTEDILEKQRISRERDTDMVTGLYNRRAYYDRMDRVFEQPELLQNAVMIMIDLDNLKKVNDVYGHAAGDQYLLACADFLKSCQKETAIASRMGGDEFSLFAYGIKTPEERQKIVDELIAYRDMHEVYVEEGERTLLEFSVGWAYCPEEKADYRALIRLADERMYEDKKIRKDKRRD